MTFIKLTKSTDKRKLTSFEHLNMNSKFNSGCCIDLFTQEIRYVSIIIIMKCFSKIRSYTVNDDEIRLSSLKYNITVYYLQTNVTFLIGTSFLMRLYYHRSTNREI